MEGNCYCCEISLLIFVRQNLRQRTVDLSSNKILAVFSRLVIVLLRNAVSLLIFSFAKPAGWYDI